MTKDDVETLIASRAYVDVKNQIYIIKQGDITYIANKVGEELDHARHSIERMKDIADTRQEEKIKLAKSLKKQIDDLKKQNAVVSNHEIDLLKRFSLFACALYFKRKFVKESYTVDEILSLLNNDVELFLEKIKNEKQSP